MRSDSFIRAESSRPYQGTDMGCNASIRLESLIDNIPGMVFRCLYDNGLTIQYVSRGSVALLGYDPTDIIGTATFRELVQTEDQPNNKKILKSISPGNPRYQLIYRIRTASGENKWVKEDGVAIYAPDGECTALEGLLTDVTAEKIAEIELLNENRLFKHSLTDRYKLGCLIGKSPAMQRVYDIILKAARNMDASVIIIGESGTGKELAARAIHDLSERRNGPFVPVNCGAIPENLIESEFFGHVKGAFTGASTEKKGYLDLADSGTLFLDEIGEITQSLQVKLLRALDEKCYTPVGGSRIKKSNFRIISATNRNLKQLLNDDLMRRDFYYRIHVIPLEMPPLRERKEDLSLLIESFLDRHGASLKDATLPSDFLMRMKHYGWPGNVRELRNWVDRFLTLGEQGFADVPQAINDSRSCSESKTIESFDPCDLVEAMDKYEHKLIVQTLEQHQWHKGKTAAALSICTRSLQRKLKKYRIG